MTKTAAPGFVCVKVAVLEYSVLTDGIAKLMLLAPSAIATSPLFPTVVGKFNVIEET